MYQNLFPRLLGAEKRFLFYLPVGILSAIINYLKKTGDHEYLRTYIQSLNDGVFRSLSFIRERFRNSFFDIFPVAAHLRKHEPEKLKYRLPRACHESFLVLQC